jgi:hypothetical protein
MSSRKKHTASEEAQLELDRGSLAAFHQLGRYGATVKRTSGQDAKRTSGAVHGKVKQVTTKAEAFPGGPQKMKGNTKKVTGAAQSTSSAVRPDGTHLGLNARKTDADAVDGRERENDQSETDCRL